MELKKEDIKNYVGYRFIVEPVKKLTVKEYDSMENAVDKNFNRGIHGSSGYSGFAGISGYVPVYAYETIQLLKHGDIEIIECARDNEWIRILYHSEYASINNPNYGSWVKTDNFIEAYTIMAAFEPVEK